MCASPILTHCGLTAILCVCVSVWRNISVLGQISVSSGLFPLSFMRWRFLYLVLFYASWIKYTLTFSGVKLIVMSWNDAYLICKHCLLLLSLESEHYIIKKTNNNLKWKSLQQLTLWLTLHSWLLSPKHSNCHHVPVQISVLQSRQQSFCKRSPLKQVEMKPKCSLMISKTEQI